MSFEAENFSAEELSQSQSVPTSMYSPDSESSETSSIDKSQVKMSVNGLGSPAYTSCFGQIYDCL